MSTSTLLIGRSLTNLPDAADLLNQRLGYILGSAGQSVTCVLTKYSQDALKSVPSTVTGCVKYATCSATHEHFAKKALEEVEDPSNISSILSHIVGGDFDMCKKALEIKKYVRENQGKEVKVYIFCHQDTGVKYDRDFVKRLSTFGKEIETTYFVGKKLYSAYINKLQGIMCDKVCVPFRIAECQTKEISESGDKCLLSVIDEAMLVKKSNVIQQFISLVAKILEKLNLINSVVWFICKIPPYLEKQFTESLSSGGKEICIFYPTATRQEFNCADLYIGLNSSNNNVDPFLLYAVSHGIPFVVPQDSGTHKYCEYLNLTHADKSFCKYLHHDQTEETITGVIQAIQSVFSNRYVELERLDSIQQKFVRSESIKADVFKISKAACPALEESKLDEAWACFVDSKEAIWEDFEEEVDANCNLDCNSSESSSKSLSENRFVNHPNATEATSGVRPISTGNNSEQSSIQDTIDKVLDIAKIHALTAEKHAQIHLNQTVFLQYGQQHNNSAEPAGVQSLPQPNHAQGAPYITYPDGAVSMINNGQNLPGVYQGFLGFTRGQSIPEGYPTGSGENPNQLPPLVFPHGIQPVPYLHSFSYPQQPLPPVLHPDCYVQSSQYPNPGQQPHNSIHDFRNIHFVPSLPVDCDKQGSENCSKLQPNFPHSQSEPAIVGWNSRSETMERRGAVGGLDAKQVLSQKPVECLTDKENETGNENEQNVQLQNRTSPCQDASHCTESCVSLSSIQSAGVGSDSSYLGDESDSSMEQRGPLPQQHFAGQSSQNMQSSQGANKTSSAFVISNNTGLTAGGGMYAPQPPSSYAFQTESLWPGNVLNIRDMSSSSAESAASGADSTQLKFPVSTAGPLPSQAIQDTDQCSSSPASLQDEAPLHLLRIKNPLEDLFPDALLQEMAEGIAVKRKIVGRFLNVRRTDTIAEQYKDNITEAAFQILKAWRNNAGPDKRKAYDNLCRALDKSCLTNILDWLKTKVPYPS